MTDNTISKHYGMFVGLLLGTSLFALGSAVVADQVWNWQFEWKFFCLLLLFLIPFVMQWRGVWLLYKRLTAEGEHGTPTGDKHVEPSEGEHAKIVFSVFYLITMAICLLSYLGLWLVYIILKNCFKLEAHHQWGVTNGWSLVFTFFSVLALFFIVLLLLLVAKMTRAAIEGEPLAAPLGGQNRTEQATSLRWGWKLHRWTIWNINYLRSGVTQEPYLSLVFFLTVFLGVSYLLGLAFAFHDKSQPYDKPALYMKNLDVPAAAAPSPVQSPVAGAAPVPPPVATFEFTEGSGVFLTGGISAESEGLAAVVKKIDEEFHIETPPASANAEEKWLDKSIRVTVIGGADIRSLQNPAYRSNYELAEARANHVKKLLLNELSTGAAANRLRNITWECLAEPKEAPAMPLPRNQSGRRAKPPAGPEGQEDRTVRVYLGRGFEEPTSLLIRHLQASRNASLNLLDYVYFANYTITTTGYGDIIPVTPYAKFICSFANICEVFFLVVFFNALLSLKKNKVEAVMSDRVGDMSPKVDKLHEKYIVARFAPVSQGGAARHEEGGDGQAEQSGGETGGPQ